MVSEDLYLDWGIQLLRAVRASTSTKSALHGAKQLPTLLSLTQVLAWGPFPHLEKLELFRGGV